jgi:hypothetical protein
MVMTAANVNAQGVPVTVSAKPTDTNEATLFSVGQKPAVLVALVLCNNDGSARTATVQWNDGSTDYEIYTALSIAANTSVFAEPFIAIPAGGSLKITQGTASGITFTATLVESVGALGGQHGK